MLISQNLVKGMIKDMYDWSFEKYDQIEETWPQYWEEKEIDGDHWQTTSVVNSGSWRKTGQAEGFQSENINEGYTVYGQIFDYTQAICINKATMKDLNKVKDILKETSSGWGESAKDTREEFYARFFNKGGILAGDWIFNGTPESQAQTDSSGDLAYDSKPFFALSGNNRSSIGGSTYYNGFAYSATPDNIKTIWTHMTCNNNRRENDTRMRMFPNIVLIPRNLQLTMGEILESTLVAYGSTNTKNVLQNLVRPVINDFIDDTDAFALGVAKKGLMALKRQEPVYDFFEDKKNRCWWATGEQRIGGVMKNFRFWCGSNWATT